MQPGDRPRLAFKSPVTVAVRLDAVQQRLQRNRPLQRLLHLFINDTHPAAADLTHNAELAESFGNATIVRRRSISAERLVKQC